MTACGTNAKAKASTVLCGLIDAVVLHAGERGGEVLAELRGEIAALMQPGEAEQQKTRVVDAGLIWLRGEDLNL